MGFYPINQNNKTPNELKIELKNIIIKHDISIKAVNGFIENLFQFFRDNSCVVSPWASMLMCLGEEFEWYNNSTFETRMKNFIKKIKNR